MQNTMTEDDVFIDVEFVERRHKAQHEEYAAFPNIIENLIGEGARALSEGAGNIIFLCR